MKKTGERSQDEKLAGYAQQVRDLSERLSESIDSFKAKIEAIQARRRRGANDNQA